MRVAELTYHEAPSTMPMKENSESNNTLAKEEEIRELEVPIQKLKK